MRWGEAVTLQFVKIYLKHECLWNPGHPTYKMKYEREKAYTEIYKEFYASTSKELTIPEIKVKIKNLRTTYLQQVNKILQKSNPDSIYEPSLVWFHEMDRCLKNIPVNRHSSTSSTSQQAPEVDSSCQIWVESENQNDNKEEPNPDPLISQNYDSSQEEGNMKRERSSSPTSKKIKKKKYKHRSRSPDLPAQDPSSESRLRDDEFDIYGKFIASQLRQMDLHKAIRLQLEIQSLVGKARISDA